MALDAALTAGRLGVPYVLQPHGMLAPDSRKLAWAIDRFAVRRAFGGAAACLALSTSEREQLSRDFGAPKVVELGNGVELPAGLQSSNPATVVCLFAARLHPRKRVAHFIAAAGTLLAEGIDADFTIIGADDGDLATVRRALGGAPSLARERIRYEGAMPREEALTRIAACSVYVLPSVHEPFPMSAIEAISLGKPTVITDTNGLTDLPYDSGATIVRSDDVGDLTEKLRDLLASPSARDRAAARARAAAPAFSMANVGERLVETYRRALLAEAT